MADGTEESDNLVSLEQLDAPAFYANHCQVAVTVEEAVLMFVQRGLKGMVPPKGVVTIYTSLPHLKRIAKTLTKTVQKHEERFGEIVIDLEEQALQSETEKSDGTN